MNGGGVIGAMLTHLALQHQRRLGVMEKLDRFFDGQDSLAMMSVTWSMNAAMVVVLPELAFPVTIINPWGLLDNSVRVSVP